MAETAVLTIDPALALLSAPSAEAEPVPVAEYLAARPPLADDEVELSIDAVTFIKELYPRLAFLPSLVDRYVNVLHNLPPIEVNQRHELIDGWHRREAHKKAGMCTIRVRVTDVKDTLHHSALAIERNATHGLARSDGDQRLADEIEEYFDSAKQGVAELQKILRELKTKLGDETFRAWLIREFPEPSDADQQERSRLVGEMMLEMVGVAKAAEWPRAPAPRQIHKV